MENYLEELREKYEDDNESFIVSYDYLGFKASKGEDPYESPQDLCKEYISDPDAELKWKELFPEVPGKLLIYLHVSY